MATTKTTLGYVLQNSLVVFKHQQQTTAADYTIDRDSIRKDRLSYYHKLIECRSYQVAVRGFIHKIFT
jgi:hypothetical protein